MWLIGWSHIFSNLNMKTTLITFYIFCLCEIWWYSQTSHEPSRHHWTEHMKANERCSNLPSEVCFIARGHKQFHKRQSTNISLFVEHLVYSKVQRSQHLVLHISYNLLLRKLRKHLTDIFFTLLSLNVCLICHNLSTDIILNAKKPTMAWAKCGCCLSESILNYNLSFCLI